MIVALCPLCFGGCPRPEDLLEPNDSKETATRLVIGMSVEGRVVQGNADVFVVSAAAGGTLVFDMQSIGEEEEDCVAFALVSPEGDTLYSDHRPACRLETDPPTQGEGVRLTHDPGVGYELTAPADVAGDYVLTLIELGEVDNLFTYSWRYRLTARTE